MANHKHIPAFILSSEGGVSSDPNDPAAKWKRPAGLGAIHTNKGITWPAFQAALGCDESKESLQLFLEMKYETWLQVWKKGFWDVVYGDLIQNQRVADIIAWWAWGSGGTTAIWQTQNVLRMQNGIALSVDGVMGAFTLNAINSVDSNQLFWQLFQARIDFIFTICKRNPKLEMYKHGWVNALTHFLKFNDMGKV